MNKIKKIFDKSQFVTLSQYEKEEIKELLLQYAQDNSPDQETLYIKKPAKLAKGKKKNQKEATVK